jgi:hypothetical protein
MLRIVRTRRILLLITCVGVAHNMAYSLHIERPGSNIPLEEWLAAASTVDVQSFEFRGENGIHVGIGIAAKHCLLFPVSCLLSPEVIARRAVPWHTSAKQEELWERKTQEF